MPEDPPFRASCRSDGIPERGVIYARAAFTVSQLDALAREWIMHEGVIGDTRVVRFTTKRYKSGKRGK